MPSTCCAKFDALSKLKTVPRGDLILFPHYPRQDASSISELTQAKSFGNWPTENIGKSTFVQKGHILYPINEYTRLENV